MAPDEHPTFWLTVRQASGDAHGFEYIIARRGMEAVRSVEYFETYQDAKAAGSKHALELVTFSARSSADEVSDGQPPSRP